MAYRLYYVGGEELRSEVYGGRDEIPEQIGVTPRHCLLYFRVLASTFYLPWGLPITQERVPLLS